MISEDAIVRKLRGLSHGFIGDDAAVLPGPGTQRYVITQDMLMEHVHFRTRYCTPCDLAHKALHVSLSDVAAMGAEPLYVLCGLSIPDTLQHDACDYLDAFTAACADVGVILIGGDTTRSHEHLCLSVTAIGQASDSQLRYRHTAQTGDVICVAGHLGWAQLGLAALEHRRSVASQYVESFLRPRAKIQEGPWLGSQASVTSMMDVSDGLYLDLKRLCEASHRGAVIDLDGLSRYQLPELSLEGMLEGGEDYGLLFTVSQGAFADVSHAFVDTFHDEPKVIGQITSDTRVRLRRQGTDTHLHLHPFTHFGERHAV